VAEVLGFPVGYIRDLNTKMHEADVYSLIDQRKGQIQDYNAFRKAMPNDPICKNIFDYYRIGKQVSDHRFMATEASMLKPPRHNLPDKIECGFGGLKKTRK
jgi:hypothetical protein